MEGKECKIVCDGKEIGTITFTKDGFNVKCNHDALKECHEHKGDEHGKDENKCGCCC